MSLKNLFGDPRPRLAKEWLHCAQKYEENLRANTFVRPQIVDAILEDAEKTISRMGSQAKKRFPQPFGWITYLLLSLFSDPHPPFILRRWLLRKHARHLNLITFESKLKFPNE